MLNINLRNPEILFGTIRTAEIKIIDKGSKIYYTQGHVAIYYYYYYYYYQYYYDYDNYMSR